MNKDTNHYVLTPSSNAELLNLSLSFLNKARRFAWSFVLASVTCAALVLLSGNQPALAQTFNDAIDAQLARNPSTELGCARLVGGSPRDPFTEEPLDFGPQLADICGPVRPGAGQSTGPNATAGSGASPVTGAVERRLQAIREEEREAAPRVSVFFSAPNYKDLDRDTTKFEDGYNSHILGGTVGADVLINNSWVVGLAFDFKRWEGDFKSGGGFDTNIYSPIVFASFFPLEGFFTDVVLSYSRKDVSSNRLRIYINELDTEFGGKVSSDPDENEFKLGVSVGYDYPIGQFTVGPRLALDYASTDLESYAEIGKTGLELKFDKDSRVSFQSKLGGQASMAISTAFGVVVPQISGDWIHEYADDQRTIGVQFAQDLRANPAKFTFQTDKPDRDFFEISAGVLVTLPHGIQAFANFRTLQGHTFLDSKSVTAGFRVEF